MQGLVFLVLVVLGAASAQEGLDEYDMYTYPSTLSNHEDCGRDSNRRIYVCDPNKIITEDNARQIDVLIETVMNETACQCSQQVCSRPQEAPGYRISVALLKKMKLTEEKQDGDAVQNQLRRAISEASVFAMKKLSEWKIGRCSDDILILYSMMDRVLYTVTGDEASKKLTPSLIGEIGMLRKSDLSGDASKGLTRIVSDYKAVLLGMYKSMEYEQVPPKYEAVRGAATSPMSLLLATILTLLLTIMSHLF